MWHLIESILCEIKLTAANYQAIIRPDYAIWGAKSINIYLYENVGINIILFVNRIFDR